MLRAEPYPTLSAFIVLLILALLLSDDAIKLLLSVVDLNLSSEKFLLEPFFVAVAITVFSLVTLNIKKNNAPKVSIEELEAEANADAEADSDVAEEASEEQAVSEDENPDQE